MTCSPVRLPAEVFEKLHFLPAPIQDASKEHYQKLSSGYGSTPTVKDKPSLKFSLEATTEDRVGFSSSKGLEDSEMLYLLQTVMRVFEYKINMWHEQGY